MRISRISRCAFFALLLRAAASRGEPADAIAGCDEDATCAEQAARAHQLSKEGNLEDALRLYQAAYQLRADPKLLFNIARVLHKLGRRAEAATYYQRYLHADTENIPEQRQKAQDYLMQAEREEQSSKRTDAREKEPLVRAENPRGIPSVSASPALPPAMHSRRPLWRLAIGSVFLGGGLVVGGFGSSALAANGTCLDVQQNTMTCSPYRDTLSVGLGLFGSGAGLVAIGTVMLALPGK